MRIAAMGFLLLASAASAQTFDFTGVITQATPDPVYNPVVVGSPVSGSFTFDFANAQAVTGKLGSASWAYTETSPPTTYPILPIAQSSPPTVFFMTLQSGSFIYTSYPADSSTLNDSSIAGQHGILTASEDANPASLFPYAHYASSITLNGYNSEGLPISSASGSGQVTLAVHGSFYDTEDFSIRRIVPVPEVDPDFAAGCATLLLSALAMARGRYVRPG
jgi:hypothetical protein